MPRKLHGVSVPKWDPPNSQTEWTLKLKVITPMFGGGYKAREVDPVCIIRPAAIRGQLRFWWRATVGTRYPTKEKLYEEEEDIWGSVEKPGKVILRVHLLEPGDIIKCGEYERDRRDNSKYRSLPRFQTNWPPYALQPFQGELSDGRRVIKVDCATARLNTVFALYITTPSPLRKDVETAVHAWISYGGIGARTRRGCGTLGIVADGKPPVTSVETGAPSDLTKLPGSHYVAGEEVNDAIVAWGKAVKVYRDFRQQPNFAREPLTGTPPTPGRSRWPEPDSIRRISGSAGRGHDPAHPVEKGFPRADLGLPIIFHFKDYDDRIPAGQANDPADTTLEGSSDGMRRFASPVITKAIQMDVNRFRPLVLVMNAPHVWHYGDLKLSGGASANIAKSLVDLSPTQRAKIHPLHKYSDKPVREALLEYVADQWKKKVEVVK